jgi:hypothetical protein
MRLGSEIPSISTAHAQAQRCCAQVIHIFVHSQQLSSPGRPDRQQPISAPPRAVAQPAGRTRGYGPGADEIVPEPAADAGRHLGSGRRRRRLPRLLPLVAARPRGDLACAPPAVTRVIAAGILTVAGVPVLEEDVPAGQNQTRPPMYEMGGLVRHRHARSGQLPGLLASRADRRCQASVRDPVSRLLPRSRGRPQGGARFQR